MDQQLWRRAMRASTGTRPGYIPCARRFGPLTSLRHGSSILDSSLWNSLIPKPLRRRQEPTVDWGAPKKAKSKEWNPATFYIVLFLCVGSMSIQMIALRKEFDTFVRRADVRIMLLRDVIEKLQRGEKIDVDKEIGTGEPGKEAGWEEGLYLPWLREQVSSSESGSVLRDMERDDIISKGREREKQSAHTRVKPNIAPPQPLSTQSIGEKQPTGPKKADYSSFF